MYKYKLVSRKGLGRKLDWIQLNRGSGGKSESQCAELLKSQFSESFAFSEGKWESTERL